MTKKWVNVRRSNVHWRRAHNVSGYSQKCSVPMTIKPHKRRARRTDAQIQAAQKRTATRTRKKGGRGRPRQLSKKK